MTEELNFSMYVNLHCLVVPIQVDFHDEYIQQLQIHVLKKIADTGLKGMVIDVSDLVIIDSFMAKSIFNIARMALLLGAKSVITGLRPEVVSTLIDLETEPGDVSLAVSLDQGLRMLERDVNPK